MAPTLRYVTRDCKRVKETKMNKTKTLAALTLMIATLGAASLFADNRRPETTNRGRGGSYDSRRVTVEGRVRDIDRDRNGIVIRLDRGGYVLVLDRDDREARRLERGDVVRASGYLSRGNTLRVSDIDVVRDNDDRRLTGVVTNVDRRGNLVWVELERTGRVIAVDVRRVDGTRNRYDVDNLRRGDRITVSGEWQRNGRFEADRLDVDRGARW
jgi:tRNA(Ile2) C34 agmatinyltransferase TiaS